MFFWKLPSSCYFHSIHSKAIKSLFCLVKIYIWAIKHKSSLTPYPKKNQIYSFYILELKYEFKTYVVLKEWYPWQKVLSLGTMTEHMKLVEVWFAFIQLQQSVLLHFLWSDRIWNININFWFSQIFTDHDHFHVLLLQHMSYSVVIHTMEVMMVFLNLLQITLEHARVLLFVGS